jgi:hypothetical protein
VGSVSQRTVTRLRFLYFFYCGDDSSFPPRTPGGVRAFTTAKRQGDLQKSMELLRWLGVANTHFMTQCKAQRKH